MQEYPGSWQHIRHIGSPAACTPCAFLTVTAGAIAAERGSQAAHMYNTTGDDDDGQPSSVQALARMHSRRGIAGTLGVLQTRASPLSAAHMAGLFTTALA